MLIINDQNYSNVRPQTIRRDSTLSITGGSIQVAFSHDLPPSNFLGITYPEGVHKITTPTGLRLWIKGNSAGAKISDGIYSAQEAIQKAIREAQILAASSGVAAKLAAKRNIGTTSAQGHVINTSAATLNTLEVINNYITTPLLEKELQAILDNRDKFLFKLWVGDRRGANASLIARIGEFPDWIGQDGTFEKETTLVGALYPFTLVFGGLTMSIADSHSVPGNTYGSIRGMEINKK